MRRICQSAASANPTQESLFALGLEKSGREGLAKRRKDVGKAVVFWQSLMSCSPETASFSEQL